MKLLAFCITIIFLLSCHSPVKHLETDQKNQTQINSIPSNRRGVKIKDLKSIASALDTVNKYGFATINDSLRKIIYGINGFCFYEGQGKWFPAMFNVVLVEIKKISQRSFEFNYSIFANDSSAVLLQFNVGCYDIHTFEYDYIEKKIIKTSIGQETSTIAGDGIISIYKRKVNSNEFKKNIEQYHNLLSAEFIRLMTDRIKK